MSKIFISYRRGDNPDGVKLVYERLRKLLPSWDVFYDHHSIELGAEFPERLREAVADAEFVLVIIGPKWLELLKDRRDSGETDFVHEEVRLAFESESAVIPVVVGNADFLNDSDLKDFVEINSLAKLNGKALRPEPDFDSDVEKLVGYLEARGPGVIVGSVLDSKYKLTREVGTGGMGLVYEAVQSNPERRVAIKLIKPGQDTREVLARFDAERQALALMDHENIAQVFDVGKSYSGRPYFVMEFVNGIPITDYCNQERLPIDKRLELFRKVCAAVQHAHQKGVLHRDIKPGNVLVTEIDGQAIPKVIDFGLAKALGGKLSHHTFFTQLQTAVGTFGYSSPEQAAGKNVDTTTDIYSLGALLYEMLVGAPPFDVEELKSAGEDAMRRHVIDKEPVKPSTKFSSSGAATVDISKQRKIDPTKLQRILEGELDWVIMKALEKDRNRRYVTANDFASDIERYLNDEAVTARPPSTGYRVSKFVRKNRGLVASVAAIGFLLLAGIIGTSYGFLKANQQTAEAVKQRGIAETKTKEALIEKDRADKERKQARKNESRAINAESKADQEARRARESESAAKLQLAIARWENNRVAEARELLRQIPIEDRDNFEWHYCNRNFLGSDLSLYGHTGEVDCVAFSPDGKRIVSGGRDILFKGDYFGPVTSGSSSLKVWDASSGKELLTLSGHSGWVTAAAFSPDGKQIVSGSWDNTLKIWDAVTGKELLSLSGHSEIIECVAFSPDGKRIVSGSWDKTLRIWDAFSGKELLTFSGHTDNIGCVAFSPDGKRIVSGSWDNTLRIWDAFSGKELLTLSHTTSVSSVGFSPDGKRVVSGGFDLKVWDSGSGKELRTLRHTGAVSSVAFSPDGNQILGGYSDKTLKLWDVSNGKELLVLKGHTGRVNCVAFSPDGKRIVSGGDDQTLKFWDVSIGSEHLAFNGHTETINSVGYSPDGERIVSGSNDHKLKLWDASNGNELSTLSGHAGGVNSAAFSPDGKRIVSGSEDNTLKVWNTSSGKELLSIKGHSHPVESVSFSPDGKRIVSGSSETFRLWDASTGKELLNIKLPATHFAALDTACFSPDGKRIISGIRHRIRLWDAYSGNELLTLSGHSSFVKAVGFSPDGKRVVSGSSDKTLKLWDASTGKELLTLSGHTDGVTSAAFSPDGKRIISVSRDGTLKLWDSSSGKELLTLTGTGWFTKSVCFSPDGKQIISGAGNKIKLWDASSGNELLTLSGHTGKVTCVSFSPDDKRIVSGGAGNKIKLWDASSGDELLTLTGRTFSVSRSAVHSDGHHTATSHFHSASKVVFSSDGKQIHSEDSASEKYTWNSKNGNPISDAQLHSPFDTESRMLSKDGRRKLIISGSQVLVVDLEFKETPREKAYRKVKARFKPRWHQELAAKATSEENFYAATFHNAWLVKNNPENAKLIEAFQSSYEKLEAQFKKEDRNLVDYVSPVVVETIELLHQLLVQADPNDVNKQRELSISYERLGDIHLKDGNTEEALQSFRNGMEVRQKLSAANPSDLELQRDYSTSFERLGNLYFGVNRGEEAIKIFQDWLELNQKLSKANPSHPNLQRDLMVSHYKIGAVHFENANYEVAKEKFELGVDVLNQMIAKGQLVEQSKREKVLLQGQIAECDKLVKPPEDTEQTGDESNE